MALARRSIYGGVVTAAVVTVLGVASIGHASAAPTDPADHNNKQAKACARDVRDLKHDTADLAADRRAEKPNAKAIARDEKDILADQRDLQADKCEGYTGYTGGNNNDSENDN